MRLRSFCFFSFLLLHQYQRALVNFASLDALIGAIQDFQNWNLLDIPAIFSPEYDYVKIFYSSPEYYTKCKHEELVRSQSKSAVGREEFASAVKYQLKTDDFFPYSDKEQ